MEYLQARYFLPTCAIMLACLSGVKGYVDTFPAGVQGDMAQNK